jgi:DNA processing protein
MTLLDWQACLSVDPTARRLPRLLAGLRSGEPVLPRLLASPELDAEAASRLRKIDDAPVRKAEQAGAFLLEAGAIGGAFVEAPGAPPRLFALGEGAALKGPRVAIVGTRGASAYSRAAARGFARALADAGACIVSGGAIGIDAEAHRGALEAGGRTCAVLPGGLLPAYPPANREVFRQIVEGGGLLVSQFRLGAKPLKYTFTERNGTIAALADVVLIIEAPARSGSLVTARVAGELGRDVCVLPGLITMEGYRGSHALIRDGAQLVDHPSQVLELLGIEPREQAEAPKSGLAGRIILALEEQPGDADSLAARLGAETGEILAEITILEMEGRVMRDEKGYALRP